jgi:hypothetical protein
VQGGDSLLFGAFVRDISARKQEEQNLEQSA